MIHAFKAGGDWKTKDCDSYTVKSVNKLSDAGEGYFRTLEEALKAKPKKAATKKAATKKASEPKADNKDLLGE